MINRKTSSELLVSAIIFVVLISLAAVSVDISGPKVALQGKTVSYIFDGGKIPLEKAGKCYDDIILRETVCEDKEVCKVVPKFECEKKNVC